MDDKELLARNSERIPKNTKKVNLWCLNVWNEWVALRNALPQNSAHLFSQVPSAEVLHTVCDFELCFWLSKFVNEVRKKGGDVYPPKTLYQKKRKDSFFSICLSPQDPYYIFLPSYASHQYRQFLQMQFTRSLQWTVLYRKCT